MGVCVFVRGDNFQFIASLWDTYTQHKFYPWLFSSVPRGFWNDPENQRAYLDWIAVKLKINSPNEWYRFTNKDIQKEGGGWLLQKHGSLFDLLKRVYPESNWDVDFLGSSFSQKQLFQFLKKFRSLADIKMNYRHPQLCHSKSNKKMELDVYIPSLKLAFEFQGGQHYKQTPYSSLRKQLERDTEKKEACKQLGISLIELPYWLAERTLNSEVKVI